VAISLVGIGSGIVVLGGMLSGQRFAGWTKTFLVTTIATSVTGFLFPVDHFMRSHAIGIVSLIVLAAAWVALYRRHLAGIWRYAFVVFAVFALYLNVFVLIVQCFRKVPALHALAPNQIEPPFVFAQLLTQSLFIAAGIVAALRFPAGTTEHSPTPSNTFATPA
jgi:hypothetical protein